MKQAANLGISCMNIVNVEDSPITKVINELSLLSGDDEGWFESENIGLYMKSGFCHSDVKAFIPEVISLGLVALWFSHAKSSSADKQSLRKREQLIGEIERLPTNLLTLVDPRQLEIYSQVAKMLKNQHNLFILAKGSGLPVANYMIQKFLSITRLHAEAYPCAEFRHGPLSMIDEIEKTPGK